MMNPDLFSVSTHALSRQELEAAFGENLIVISEDSQKRTYALAPAADPYKGVLPVHYENPKINYAPEITAQDIRQASLFNRGYYMSVHREGLCPREVHPHALLGYYDEKLGNFTVGGNGICRTSHCLWTIPYRPELAKFCQNIAKHAHFCQIIGEDEFCVFVLSSRKRLTIYGNLDKDFWYSNPFFEKKEKESFKKKCIGTRCVNAVYYENFWVVDHWGCLLPPTSTESFENGARERFVWADVPSGSLAIECFTQDDGRALFRWQGCDSSGWYRISGQPVISTFQRRRIALIYGEVIDVLRDQKQKLDKALSRCCSNDPIHMIIRDSDFQPPEIVELPSYC